MSSARVATLSFLVLVFLSAVDGRAQVGQYMGPGSLVLSQRSPAEAVREGAENARWRKGPFRLEPRFSLRSIGYEDNVFASAEGEEQTSDVHAVVGAGLAAYSKLGAKVYVSAFAAPEYTWWQDLDELSALSVNYGGAAFGLFNRLELGVQGISTERERLLSNEAEVPVRALEERVMAEARIELRPRLAIEGQVTRTEYRYADEILGQRPDLLVQQLESDTDRLQALLSLTFRGGFELGIGIEDQDTDFLLDPGGRSNSGTSPVVRLAYDGSRLRLEGRLVAKTTEFDNPDLARYEETTGSMLLDVQLGQETSASLYAGQNLVFGVQGLESTIGDSRWGISFQRQLGGRMSTRLYGETGRSEFQDPAGPNAGRSDDLSAYGLETTVDLTQLLALKVRFWQIDYASNLPEFDRSTTRFGVGIELSEGLLPW